MELSKYKLTWNSEDFIRFCNIVSLSILTFLYLFLYHNLPWCVFICGLGSWNIDSENSEDYLNINWQMRIPKISLKIKWQWQFMENSEDFIRFCHSLINFNIHLLIYLFLQWYVFIWGWDGILKEWGLSEFDRQWQMSEWQVWQFAMILSHFVTLSLENGSWEVIGNN